MSKTVTEKSASTTEEPAEDLKKPESTVKTDEPAKAEIASEHAKKEKAFSKAEVEAAAKKAVDDAKRKWDDEKDLTELERLKRENVAMAEGIRLRDARDEVVAALHVAGVHTPALAFEAIKGDLKFDDAGKLVNSKDLIDGLRSKYPEQFGVPKPAEGIDAGAGQQGAGQKLTKEKLAGMTPDEINKLDWKDVAAVMSSK